jgi:hypothetical protein
LHVDVLLKVYYAYMLHVIVILMVDFTIVYRLLGRLVKNEHGPANHVWIPLRNWNEKNGCLPHPLDAIEDHNR